MISVCLDLHDSARERSIVLLLEKLLLAHLIDAQYVTEAAEKTIAYF